MRTGNSFVLCATPCQPGLVFGRWWCVWRARSSASGPRTHRQQLLQQGVAAFGLQLHAPHFLESKLRLNPCHELLAVEGLCDVVVGSGLERRRAGGTSMWHKARSGEQRAGEPVNCCLCCTTTTTTTTTLSVHGSVHMVRPLRVCTEYDGVNHSHVPPDPARSPSRGSWQTP